MPSKPRNRVGEVYGQLTVVRLSDRRTKSGNAFWWCRCSCGRDQEVPGDKLPQHSQEEASGHSLFGLLKGASGGSGLCQERP